MQQLKLDELLRYGFSGGLLLLCLFLMYPASIALLPDIDKLLQTVFITGLVFLIGSLIYSLHRAIAYPIVLRLVILILVVFKVFPLEKDFLVPYKPARLEMKHDFERWYGAGADDRSTKIVAEWASQMHFLYCATWAMLSAQVIGRFVFSDVPPNRKAANGFIILSIVTVLGALLHHIRLKYYVKSILEREKLDARTRA